MAPLPCLTPTRSCQTPSARYTLTLHSLAQCFGVHSVCYLAFWSVIRLTMQSCLNPNNIRNSTMQGEMKLGIKATTTHLHESSAGCTAG